MLRVMRDETVDHARRDAMAKAVAPYCHPQLASVAVKDETRPEMTEEELDLPRLLASLPVRRRSSF
jgi:hypothetical protein